MSPTPVDGSSLYICILDIRRDQFLSQCVAGFDKRRPPGVFSIILLSFSDTPDMLRDDVLQLIRPLNAAHRVAVLSESWRRFSQRSTSGICKH